MNFEISKDTSGDTVVPLIRLMPQPDIRLHRVHALILKIVGLHLFPEADAPTFLSEVDQNACFSSTKILQGMPELIPTIASPRTKHVAGQTLRVYAHGYTRLTRHIADHQSQMLLAMLRI